MNVNDAASIRKSAWSALKWLGSLVGTLVITAYVKGEQLKGLSYGGKLKFLLTVGVPLWFVFPVTSFAAYAGWKMYQFYRKPEARTVGETNYYFKTGDDRPYCQICYDSRDKLVLLPPARELTNGIGRTCTVCTRQFIEQSRPPGPPKRMFTNREYNDSVSGADG